MSVELASSVSVPSSRRLTRSGLIQLRQAASPISWRMRLVTRAHGSSESPDGGGLRSISLWSALAWSKEAVGLLSDGYVWSLPDMQYSSGPGFCCHSRRSTVERPWLEISGSQLRGARCPTLQIENKQPRRTDILIDTIACHFHRSGQ